MPSDNQLIEQCLSSQPVYQGRVLDLRVDTVRLPDGNTGTREVARHPGGVVVMPVLPDGHLVLVRQFRYALGHALIEFPAGKLDRKPDGSLEDTLPAIKRELQEETGYVADHWEDLGFIYTAPGFTNERLYLFRASGLHEAERYVQPDEFVETLILTVDEVFKHVRQGEITDAKTICLLAKTYTPSLH